MNEQQIAVVQSTWAQVTPIAETAAGLFYGRLFEVAPGVRSLFTGDMDEQGRKLMRMIGMAVSSLERRDGLPTALEALGRRHAGYGALPEHYPVVGATLLWTLEHGLGEAFTDEAREAWTAAYELLADAMLEGAAAAA